MTYGIEETIEALEKWLEYGHEIFTQPDDEDFTDSYKALFSGSGCYAAILRWYLGQLKDERSRRRDTTDAVAYSVKAVHREP